MKEKPELERKIEGRVLKWARSQGWRYRKMNGMGDRGWPDRLFVGPGVMAFIEFKKLGEEPTPKQWDNINALRKFGHRADWFDDSDAAIAWLKDLESKAVHEKGGQVRNRKGSRRTVP